MPKNIVLYSDGTGDQNINNQGTHVFRIYEAVDIHDQKNDPAKFFATTMQAQKTRL